MVCYEGQYNTYLPVAIVFGLVVEVVGLPAGILLWMWRNNMSEKRHDLATYNMVRVLTYADVIKCSLASCMHVTSRLSTGGRLLLWRVR